MRLFIFRLFSVSSLYLLLILVSYLAFSFLLSFLPVFPVRLRPALVLCTSLWFQFPQSCLSVSRPLALRVPLCLRHPLTKVCHVLPYLFIPCPNVKLTCLCTLTCLYFEGTSSHVCYVQFCSSCVSTRCPSSHYHVYLSPRSSSVPGNVI